MNMAVNRKTILAFVLLAFLPGMILSGPTLGFERAIEAGNAAAEQDQPNQALVYYQQALDQASSKAQQKDARFALARIYVWLARYLEAEQQYQWILEQKPSQQEYELALAGLVKCLAYRDRPREAYALIPPTLHYTEPELVTAAAQAAWWSDWPDRSKAILETHAKDLKAVEKDSVLGLDIQDTAWGAEKWTSPYFVGPTFFFQGDSVDFYIIRSILSMTRNWSYTWQTTLLADYTFYTQDGSSVNSERFQVLQYWNPTRQLSFRGGIKPSIFEDWYPVLWTVGATYQPNDTFTIDFGTERSVVEAFPALLRHITEQDYRLTATLNPLPYIQLVGSYDYVSLSDDNFRNGYFAQAGAMILPQYGFNIALRSRGYFHDFNTDAYYSPVAYTQNLFVANLSGQIGHKWRYYAETGAGVQTQLMTQGDITTVSPSWIIDVGLSGDLSKNISVNADYSFRQQAFGSSTGGGPGYWYQIASLGIILVF